VWPSGALRIEGRGVPWVKRGTHCRSMRQVRIGDEKLAESNCARLASREHLSRTLLGEPFIRNIGAAERSLELRAEPRFLH
jgi:hypothetical protein